MNVQNLIVSALQHSVMEVFSTMLSGDIQLEGLNVAQDTPESNDRVVSFIGLAGTWSGTGTLTCSPTAACRLCSQMLLVEYSSVSEEVLDAVAEVTNMIIGNVKSNLERHLGPLGLSIPTVVFGRNFKTKTAGAEWIEERFRWEGEDLVLRVSLRPNERTGTMAAAPEVCTMGL
jgi:chemotaxis protein CheX